MAITTAWKAVTRKGLVGSSPTSSAMKFFENTLAEQPRIEEAIKRYGYAPEHNFWWYQFQPDEDSKNVFVEFDKGAGLFTIERKDKKNCIVFAGPIAPISQRVPILVEYLEHMLKFSNIEKVTLELETDLYKEFISSLPEDLKARAGNFILTWPVYDLKAFNSELSGKHWKTLRKEKNRFYQNHSVESADAKTYKDKESLHAIIDEWCKERAGNDRVHRHLYHNFIDENFMGTSEARVFIVDGRAVGINAGWPIPNSDSFYGALGIHNYSLPDLGDMLYLEDLLFLKTKGYAKADMGGGEEALTNFKKKFQPESFYDTHTFSVVKQ